MRRREFIALPRGTAAWPIAGGGHQPLSARTSMSTLRTKELANIAIESTNDR